MITEAQVHQAVTEACNAQDYQPVVDRILIWLTQAHREGARAALLSAADDWPRRPRWAPLWLRARAQREASNRSRP